MKKWKIANRSAPISVIVCLVQYCLFRFLQHVAMLRARQDHSTWISMRNHNIDLKYKGPWCSVHKLAYCLHWTHWIKAKSKSICARSRFRLLSMQRCQTYCCLFIIIIWGVERTVSHLIDVYARRGGFVCGVHLWMFFIRNGTERKILLCWCFGNFCELRGRLYDHFLHLISHRKKN